MTLVTDKKYYLHKTLKNNLDVLKQKIKKDWFFIIIISGSNRVRIGKSTLAQQISYYLDPTYDFDALVFDPAKVKPVALKKKKYQVVHYDEARAGLDAKRAMENMQKELLDFLAEAGQLNQFLILVLPDFFELKKEIAQSQSICLINCYTPSDNIFQRGQFQFFNIYNKNKLYYWGKKRGGDYWATKPDFTGDFSNYQVLDKTRYQKAKRDALLKGKEVMESTRLGKSMKRCEKLTAQRNKLIKHSILVNKEPHKNISNLIGLERSHITKIVAEKLIEDEGVGSFI